MLRQGDMHQSALKTQVLLQELPPNILEALSLANKTLGLGSAVNHVRTLTQNSLEATIAYGCSNDLPL